MNAFAYLFEAVGVQRYVLDGGQLRAMVGASELIESLTADGGLVDDVLTAVGEVSSLIRFARRAGGAVLAVSEDANALARFATLFAAAVRQRVPGLEMLQSRGCGETAHAAMVDARRNQSAARNQLMPGLPIAGPLVARDPRTGEPAVGVERFAGQRLPVAGSMQPKLDPKVRMGQQLVRRFAPSCDPARWPRDLQGDVAADAPFPFAGDSRNVGIVHADGNRLGLLLQALSAHAGRNPQRSVELMREFSNQLRQATERAAQAATSRVLLAEVGGDDMIPARPIVLGGDDLTMIVRADLALPFAQEFLAQFEQTSREAFAELAQRERVDSLAEGLTACAGIAYCRSSQPFHLAHDLAVELCDHAKAVARPDDQAATPSAIAFHRVTTAMTAQYDQILEEELTFGPAQADDPALRVSLECYGLSAAAGLPCIDDLLNLQRLLQRDEVARGPFRQLLTLLGHSGDEMRLRYKRIQELMNDARAPEIQRRAWRDWEQCLSRLVQATGVALDPTIPASKASQHGARIMHRSPLGDALTLLAVGNAGITEERAV